MPRSARPLAPSVPQHLITRFVDREYRLNCPRDRHEYRRRVGEAFGKSDAKLCAYADMSNHTHNVPVGGPEPLGPILHAAHTGFGLWWNRTYEGLGPVFAERPKTVLIYREEGLAVLVAYAHLNPSRAGLVECPSQSDWTSHPIFLGLRPCPEYLEVEWALAEMGFSSSPSGRLAFHEFVCSRQGLGRDPTLSGPGPSSLEHARRLVAGSARYFGMDRERLARPCTRDEHVARLVFVATALELFGETGTNVAAALGVGAATISRLRSRSRGFESIALVEALIQL